MKRKPQRTIPEISTASLPDIIFILLFFFMVVTVMRTDTPTLNTVLPTTSYASRLTKSADEVVLRVGTDVNLIEIQGRVVLRSQLQESLQQVVGGLTSYDLQVMQVVLHADRTVKMLDIRAVKNALQESGLRNLRFISNERLAQASTYD